VNASQIRYCNTLRALSVRACGHEPGWWRRHLF